MIDETNSRDETQANALCSELGLIPDAALPSFAPFRGLMSEMQKGSCKEVTYSILMRAWALLGSVPSSLLEAKVSFVFLGDLPNVDHLWQQMQNRGIQPQASESLLRV